MGIRSVALAASAAIAFFSQVATAQVSVTTFHNDNSRTGQNTQETILTPANVNSSQFGKLFTVTVDGNVYAQPLYVHGVSIAGGTHNVLYVATENDSVYAIDADSGTVYIHLSLLPAGGSPGSPPCQDIIPYMGITGTPVIDLSTNTIYLVSNVSVAGGIAQFLHALDLSTLTEKFGGPMGIDATVAGTASDGNGKTVAFDAQWENQRSALTLEDGHIIITWASHCDDSPWHGWVMSYSAGSLQQEAVLNVSPNASKAGIWMSGDGPAVDGEGNIYLVTGNGNFDSNGDYGDSILKLGPPANGTFPILDYFTPWNQQTLNNNDQDLSSGGLVLLPPLPSGQQLLTQQGKFGTIVLLDEAKLGKYCPNLSPACTNNSDTNVVQEIVGASLGLFGSPTYWNGNVYFGGNKSPMQAYSFNANGSGKLSPSPTSQTAQSFPFAAPTPVVSSNGTSNGIVWALDGEISTSSCPSYACLGLFAYDATNLANVLYSSNATANGSTGATVKFAAPTVANGKVYIGTQTALIAYGLLNSTPTAAQPTFSPASGAYTSAPQITLSDTTAGAVIHYTTDGSMPSANSATYSAPLTISLPATINAIAVANGFNNSAVATGSYTLSTTGSSTVSVSLSANANVFAVQNAGTAITNGGWDGNDWAYAANLLGTSLTYNGATFTIGGVGAADAVSNTTVTLPAGNYSTLSLLGSGTSGNQLNQSFVVTYTDGTTSTFTQSLSDWWGPPGGFAGETQVLKMASLAAPWGASYTQNVYVYGYSFALNSAKTVKSITLPANRHVVILAMDLSGAGSTTSAAATPGFSPAPGAYATAPQVTLSDTTAGAVIHYTTDGSTPTATSATYSAPLTITLPATVKALAVANGFTNSAVGTGTYTQSGSSAGVTNVSLSGVANVFGVGNAGTQISNGGWDNNNYELSSSLVGNSVTYDGWNFTVGAPGVADAVSSTTIPLPAGNYTTLALVGSGDFGAQLNQAFVVTYTDGTTSTFTQSLSDWWYAPAGYAGETQVLKMASVIAPWGASLAQTVYVNGYNFALNSAKTVQSLTLPANRHVSVLAIDLIGSGSTTPVAAAVGFSPAPGAFTTAPQVTLTDSTAGAVIHYTTDGSTPTATSLTYTAPLTVTLPETIKAIAVATGFTNSPVSGGSYTLSMTGSSPTSVSLSGVANVSGIENVGTQISNGGWDDNNYAFVAGLLGTSLTYGGSAFTIGPVGVADAVSDITVPLPAGNFSTLSFLGSGSFGGQVNQAFVVTYTDGTTSTFTQSISDWWNAPAGYAGETQVLKMAAVVAPWGASLTQNVYVNGYSFALNNTKTVQSLTLPANRHVMVLAIDLK